MLKIQLHQKDDTRMSDVDFVIWCRPGNHDCRPNDVQAIYSPPPNIDPTKAPPTEKVKEYLDKGQRVVIGNYIGGELGFRFACPFEPSRSEMNTRCLLQWADLCYAAAGDRLVLAPQPWDIMHDLRTGGRFMKWLGERKVPYLAFMGFRFLFPDDITNPNHVPSVMISKYCGVFTNPFMKVEPWPPYAYAFPFKEIQDAIRENNVEAWTGVGWLDGLLNGAAEKAEAFGFKGIFTSKTTWEQYAQKTS